jgi:hypothetical protein
LAYAVYRRARAASKELEFWKLWERQLMGLAEHELELELELAGSLDQAHKLTGRAMPEISSGYNNNNNNRMTQFLDPTSPASKSCAGSYEWQLQKQQQLHHLRSVHGNRLSRSREQSPTKPGYMEGTISMRAKCKSWQSAESQPALASSSPHRRRHPSSMASCHHQIDTPPILLQWS